MRVHWTRRARRDLRAIATYIARDDRAAASAWMTRLRQRAHVAAAAPLGGRIVPEIGRADVREVFLRSYRIVYRIVGSGIRVVTVFEGHQQLPSDVEPDA